MPRTKMTPDYITSSLKALYGTEITAADVRGWCASNGSYYQTVTKNLDKYKT